MLLNSHNVFDYLSDRNLCNSSDKGLSKIESLSAKNFNLLITLPDCNKLLVKQERHDLEGNTAGEFQREWRIQEWLQKFPEQQYLSPFLPKLLHFDAPNSIAVFRYLNDYRDVMDFYSKESDFPTEIPRIIGKLLADIHRDTYDREIHRQFFTQEDSSKIDYQVPRLIRRLEKVKPEIFGSIPDDGIKFFILYQKYDSLGRAIAELGQAFMPSCLTHNDVKLNNILLHTDWKKTEESKIILIDWERNSWGDPAFDLGTIIGNYIQIWLSSLVISKSLSIEESLKLAMTPLEKVQPSIAALTKSYLETFPDIVEYRGDFLLRVVQFTGFVLIQQIQAMIQYQKSFGNTGIAMLQVAKALLCRRERSIPTVFGKAALEIVQLGTSAENLIKK